VEIAENCSSRTDANIIDSPISVQPANLRPSATKGLENGHRAGEIDDATLRKGEARYSHYFQQTGELLASAPGLAAFH
jgi:pre-mRNA-processing factor 39